MHVVDASNAGQVLEFAPDHDWVDAGRRPFQQHVGRFSRHLPAAADHEQGYERGENRIDRHPSGRYDDDARRQRRHAAHEISCYVR